MNRNRYNNHFQKLSQINRKLPEIAIDYVHPIEMNNDELINYSFKYAQYLNYYNTKNEIDGNWQEFYSANFSIILTILEQIDFYTYREKFKLLSESVQEALNLEDAILSMRELFNFLNVFLLNIEQIYKLLSSIDIFAFEDKLDPTLIEEIQQNKNKLRKWELELNAIEQSTYLIYENNEEKSAVPEQLFIFSSGEAALVKIQNAIETLHDFFVELAGKSRHQILVKKNGLKNKIVLDPQSNVYTPNLAITKAFIELYLKLIKLNAQLTKRHLDFYYKDILSQKQRSAEKDFVHLVITPGVNYESLVLKNGNLFTADFDENDNRSIVYKNVNDDVISQSKIKKLFNIYLNQTSHKKIIEKNVLTKSVSIEDPMIGIGNQNMVLFGNNQTFISDDSPQKMEDGKIGFYIGSQILFQQNGERLINVILYFEKTSFLNLKFFIDTYADLNQRDSRTLSNEFFKAAFEIYYTNKEGWIPFETFSVTFDPDDIEDCKIEYNFKLTNEEASIDLYNNPIHGDIEDIEIPLFKFIINTNSFFNAYNFTNNLNVERIGFRVSVKNETNLSLRNNLGNLSPENPFQMFGNTPGLRSFFDIQNENIFNKFTKDFTINIKWFDLPINENGFKDYFKEYEVEVDNNAYKVGISSWEHGKFRPRIPEQQVFNLFESYRINDKIDFLSTSTTISSIDFAKLKFTNEMNFNRSENEVISRHSDGMIRISLLNPIFGFGHKLFTKLFSDISLNNARWFRKKKNLPNDPISPSIKLISVDYTLETNELLYNVALKQNKQSDISLIHIHPFGYEKIYPNISKSLYSLVTNFHADNQFIIGIDQVIIGQEMSIYFELDEIKSQYNAQEDYSIQWHYLSNNTWKLFSSKNIIEDTTKNLIQSGIIKLVIPKDINKNNTIFSDSLFYIKVELYNGNNFKKQLKNIFINGVLVERCFDETYNNDLIQLNSNSIRKLMVDLPEIDQIIQPYQNFQGLPQESEDSFYIRISEMLRTKNRYVTIRDITQAILNKFNNISLVEILGNGNQNSILRKSIYHDLDMVITLIPKFSKIENYDFDNIPAVDSELLFQVKEFVKTIVPDQVKVVILNPIYEKIKVNCKVVFKESRGNNEIKIYTNLLNKEISSFIAPWIENGSENGIEIKNHIHIDDIIDFIKDRPYISMVNSLSLIHLHPIYDEIKHEISYQLNDTAEYKINKIPTSLINSIFAPANNHQITVVQDKIAVDPVKVGINDLEIGKELIIQDSSISLGQTGEEIVENMQKSNNFTLTLKL